MNNKQKKMNPINEHRLLLYAWFGIINGWLLAFIPFLQFIALLLGIVCSIATLVFHIEKLKKTHFNKNNNEKSD